MKVKLIGRKVNLPDDLRAYAEKKLSKLDKYFGEETEIKITLWTQRGRFLGEGTIDYKGTLFRAEVTKDDFFAVIDGIVLVIERQIAKNKTRLAKRLRAGSITNIIQDPLAEDIEEEKEFKIIKTKRYNPKPMSAEEAILQMNLLGHDFFVFLHDKTNDKNVVYKRNDGNYGLIELG